MTVEQVVSESVSTYLFWARIMKEHAIFIQSALPPPQAALAAQAEDFRRQFTRFLSEAVRLAGGVLPKETLESRQFFCNSSREHIVYLR
ncbi:DUF2935 domain-containing protein [Acetanaerobacterium elongatum]|uniref:DUF2935 domain-containing protein n=1 Tax=Acetanaerobacterium elongatum TaxID=258515 RepID=A0A1G9XA76_9FIRM|nr:DUF2935 domain-containing protein [Acetanaerobacterium elongatum]SDM93660.1 protein of unknown function [Acetanaerobacterium elongatum]